MHPCRSAWSQEKDQTGLYTSKYTLDVIDCSGLAKTSIIEAQDTHLARRGCEATSTAGTSWQFLPCTLSIAQSMVSSGVKSLRLSFFLFTILALTIIGMWSIFIIEGEPSQKFSFILVLAPSFGSRSLRSLWRFCNISFSSSLAFFLIGEAQIHDPYYSSDSKMLVS